MAQSYSGHDGGEAGVPADGMPPAQLLLARLLPDADAALLVQALGDERTPAAGEAAGGGRTPDAAPDPAARELRRVRHQLALGAAARGVQHALNNPLAALLAEAQLLQLEPLPDEQREAVERIVALARRMAALTRQLDG
jgi:signal transduction histidine kinase